MPIGIQTQTETGGDGVIYLDESGGYIQFSISAGGYNSVHKLHVLPFGVSASGVYDAPPAGHEANIGATADNVMALIAGIYDGTAAGAAFAAYQVLPDNTGVQPYPYSFPGTALFTAGTASGSGWPYFVEGTVAGHGIDGSRFQLHLPGPAISVASVFGRFDPASVGSPIAALMSYLTGQTNGPVHAQKTCVVSHAGEPLAAPLAWLLATNKRLRRRARVA
jgi:hypothetical protein